MKLCNITIQPGERISLALPTPELFTCAPMHIPMHVFHGKKEGPRLVICAAISGNEVNGVAIIQKLLKINLLKSLHGTLIIVPSVNIFGLISRTKHLPDGRDLESNLPGSERGSYAARLAYLFSNEVINLATHLINLHTGNSNINKVFQTVGDASDPEVMKMARAIGAPVMLDSQHLHQKFWKNHENQNIPTLRLEVGEANRLDDIGVRFGVKGLIGVLRELEMIKKSKGKLVKSKEPLLTKKQYWVRSSCSGICELKKKNGSSVRKGEVVAIISDPFGTIASEEVKSPYSGIIIASYNMPLLNEGDPIVEVAPTGDKEAVEDFEDWNTSAKTLAIEEE